MNTVLLAQQIPGECEGGRYAAEQLKNQVLEGKQLSNRLFGLCGNDEQSGHQGRLEVFEPSPEMGPETQSFKMAMAMTGSTTSTLSCRAGVCGVL